MCKFEKQEVFQPLAKWDCDRVVGWWIERTEFSQIATVWANYGLDGSDFVRMTTTHMYQVFKKIPANYKLTPDEQRKCLQQMASLASFNRMEENYIQRLSKLKDGPNNQHFFLKSKCLSFDRWE